MDKTDEPKTIHDSAIFLPEDFSRNFCLFEIPFLHPPAVHVVLRFQLMPDHLQYEAFGLDFCSYPGYGYFSKRFPAYLQPDFSRRLAS